MSAMLRGVPVAVAAVAVGLAFANAAAAQGVTVVDEASGNDCNPCSVHMTGESHITIPSSGLIVSTCQDELFAQIYANGTGELDWVGTAHGGPGCTVSNCTTVPAEAHWPITSIVESAAGVERLNARVCFRSNLGAEGHCNLSIPVFNPEPHRQELSVLSLCSGGVRRVEANWQTESAQIELVHD